MPTITPISSSSNRSLAAVLSGLLASAKRKVPGFRQPAAAAIAPITTSPFGAPASTRPHDEIAQLRAETAAAKAQVATFAAFLGCGVSEISKKTPDGLRALFEAQIQDRAIDQIASLGVDVGSLPRAAVDGAAAPKNELFAEYTAMPASNPDEAAAKAAFAQKHGLG